MDKDSGDRKITKNDKNEKSETVPLSMKAD